MLKIINLGLKRNQQTLFEQLNLTIHAGQKVAVVGRNGVGKSTLFDLILGKLQSDIGDVERPKDWRIAHMAQEVKVTDRPALDYVIDGNQPLRAAQRELAQAETEADNMRIAHCHARLEDLGVWEVEPHARAILHGLGFHNDETGRPFADFSGGWRIRLNLARALMTPAELLLLDEPTNHLDLEATLWLESWLQRFPGTLLVIAHDRDFIDNIADHVIHLHHGSGDTYRGNYSSFERQRAEAMLLQQAAFKKQQREIAHIHSFVDRFRAKASKARQAQSRLKALERMEAVAPVHADSPYRLTFPEPRKMSTPLMSIDNVAVGYGETTVLSGVKQSILPGARIGVLGENGAGKSTLLKCLVGDLQPREGELIVGQHAEIGYFAQHQLESLNPDHTGLKELRLARPDDSEQQCRDYLGCWGFPRDKLERPVATLSGGEKARLVLALLASQRPAILVLDEPTNHLDLDMRDALALALQDYSGALIIVAHDRSLLSRTVDEFWLVADGSVTRLQSDLRGYTDTYQAAMDTITSGSRGNAQTGQNRKAQRKKSAGLREQEQPLKKSIAKLERRVEELGNSLQAVETRLADPETYDSLPTEELDALLKEAASIRRRKEAAESKWLQQSEELESLASD